MFSDQFGEVVEATVQRAPDTGVERMIRITTDAVGGGAPLSNWNSYWFIVTGYGYNEIGVPRILESPYTTIEAIPQQPEGGLQSIAEYGDLITDARYTYLKIKGNELSYAFFKASKLIFKNQTIFEAPGMLHGQDNGVYRKYGIPKWAAWEDKVQLKK